MIIAQISDTHIVAKGQEWKGLPQTQIARRLKLVVDHLNALNPKPDVVLLTGDAVDVAAGLEGYAHLKEILKSLSIPLYIIPGNHDNREEMRVAFQQESYMPSDGFIHYVIDDYPVRLIALDTVIPQEPQGLLCEERIDWLTGVLKENTSKPTLIFMHHPLITIGQKLLDALNCQVTDDFESFIHSFPNIIGIISGHFHKACAAIYGGALCFVAPSVAPVHYFEKASDETTKIIELTSPSFVLHKWIKGHRLVSEVIQTLELTNRLAITKNMKNEVDR
ncbi:MAG: phosphodiesterase [Candidatus Paracaedibacter sp.]